MALRNNVMEDYDKLHGFLDTLVDKIEHVKDNVNEGKFKNVNKEEVNNLLTECAIYVIRAYNKLTVLEKKDLDKATDVSKLSGCHAKPRKNTPKKKR